MARGARTLFDVVVVVDWSAASRPRRGRDSIWLATLDVRSARFHLANPPTRAEAARALRGALQAAAGRRVLVGLDVALGFPAGFAAAARLPGEPRWAAAWDHLARVVNQADDNANNRFAVADELNRRVGDGPGPFWGCPPSAATAALSPYRAPGFPHVAGRAVLAEYRRTEVALRAAGRRVASVWQLLGAGSVGSQTLTAIPVVHRLLHDPSLARRSSVWPFTTGFDADPTAGQLDAVVYAEVWPGVVAPPPGLHPVRDAAQVVTLARHLASLDRRGDLGAWFEPALDHETEELARAEEGWILGGPPPGCQDVPMPRPQP